MEVEKMKGIEKAGDIVRRLALDGFGFQSDDQGDEESPERQQKKRKMSKRDTLDGDSIESRHTEQCFVRCRKVETWSRAPKTGSDRISTSCS